MFCARRVRAVVALPVIAGAVAWLAAQDDPVPTFTATDLLPAGLVSSAHHTVAPLVRTEGFFHEFTLTSYFGPFEAAGLSELALRVDEIRALAQLAEVSKSEVFLASAGGAVLSVGKNVARVATDPTGTAKGLGAGIKRLGVNLGRTTKRATDSALGGDHPGPAAQDSAVESTATSVLGVSAAMRRWAQKLGVDPYTRNPVLRDALRDLARIDAAGSIATKVVVPVPMVVSTTSSVGDLVWGKDPEELRKLNEQRAKELGVPDAGATAFFRNGWFTLTQQTRLLAALAPIAVPGAADYVGAASKAASDREALFFVESAEMLGRFHARTPVSAVLKDSRALVARSGIRAAVLLPLDYVRSTPDTREALAEIAARARAELRVTRLEIHLTGRMSDVAGAEARTAGWNVTAGVSSR